MSIEASAGNSRTGTRIAAALAGILFTLSAAVQWNDPDPWRWIALYLYAAGLAWALVAGWPGPRALERAAWLALAVYAGGAALMLPALLGARGEAFTSWQMMAPQDETPREAVGLLVCAAWALTVARLCRGARLSGRRPGAEVAAD